MNKKAQVIAFYLPQYHPIPENDEWWGTGFTEWTNTAKSRPLFSGHHQPNLPSDLGFYDLRSAESRNAQAKLASAYGVDAFCYYHYWFAGKQLLERPFQEVVQSGQPDHKFCLCWANQTWTGIWHGLSDRILVEQTYPGKEDYINHFYSMLPAFQDKRYYRVNDRPVFVIYCPLEIPEIRSFIDLWQELANREALGTFYFIGVNRSLNDNPDKHHLDAFVTQRLPPRTGRISKALVLQNILKHTIRKKYPTIYTYEEVYDYYIRRDIVKHIDFPCVVPNWDNSPRSGANGLVVHNSTPGLFEKQLNLAMTRVQAYPDPEKIIFLKSWNEWAEGNYVEPDLRYGHAYLEKIRDTVCF